MIAGGAAGCGAAACAAACRVKFAAAVGVPKDACIAQDHAANFIADEDFGGGFGCAGGGRFDRTGQQCCGRQNRYCDEQQRQENRYVSFLMHIYLAKPLIFLAGNGRFHCKDG